ncbi:MAG: SDR family NAD(P)-dependent oxidoreductase [Gammaproteobacteria bacterium]|nr:SDR family NAD(P)-dependent oxidoreductase [Gammaproteobacteria bacterium]
MPQKKNILILGVNDQFGDQIVEGLSAEENSLILCGGDDQQQLSLASRYPRHVKSCTDSVGLNHSHQRVQSMIEETGSLDVFIYLVDTSPSHQFLNQSHQQIAQTLNTSLVTPICILQSIFPYLRKASNSKVMFVDTSIFSEKHNFSPITVGGNYGLWGFCEGIKAEFHSIGIDVQNISYPNFCYSQEKRGTNGWGVTLYERYKKVIKRILEFIRSAGATGISQIPHVQAEATLGTFWEYGIEAE